MIVFSTGDDLATYLTQTSAVSRHHLVVITNTCTETTTRRVERRLEDFSQDS